MRIFDRETLFETVIIAAAVGIFLCLLFGASGVQHVL